VHILVTGFGGFDGVPTNPSERLVAALPSVVSGYEIRRAILPVDARGVLGALQRLWSEGPAAVIHLGVAVRRKLVSIETRAANWMEFEVPDNTGVVVQGEPIQEGGPAMIGSRLPVEPITARLHADDVPCHLSRTAGRFICNQVMYESLTNLPHDVPVGFIHVPADEALAGALGRAHHVPFAQQLHGIQAAIEVTARFMRPLATVNS
jgi:pyroglutamyl-peptidase